MNSLTTHPFPLQTPVTMTMRAFSISSLFFFFFVSYIQRESSEAQEVHAETPPRGWNSYDSFSWTISEEEYLQNAEIVKERLLNQGYQYVIVDYLWYRRKVPGAHADSLGFDVIDEWGRMIPDPDRWPSSKGGKGFSEVANKVHAMGLKFGIHVMRGISTQAVNANTPILDTTKGSAYSEVGREWRAKDIGLTDRTCAWMQHGFMSVDTTLGAGKAFLKSLYQQYADWGVDFVKHDCVFGTDFDLNEISVVSEILKGLNRPVLYSLSPGISATPDLAKDVSSLANMYRITGDDWDKWEDVASHFDLSWEFGKANKIGDVGLRGKSWPDLDMLPLGWLTDPASNEGPHRNSNLTPDEQRTQMTLWSMSKSPLFFGGDLRKLDDATFNIISHPTLLEINSFSKYNREFSYAETPDLPAGCQHWVLVGRNTSRRDTTKSEKHVMDLTTCNNYKAKGWVSEVVGKYRERICWNHDFGSKSSPFCLYKRKPFLTLHEETLNKYQSQYQGKLQLFASDSEGSCLDASPKQKLTSLQSSSYSPCRQHSNQMWEFNNGTLVSSYSGLCATMKTVQANAEPTGIRSWIAVGRKGEIYLAFFSLNSVATDIHAHLRYIGKAIPNVNVRSCTYKEVWTGKDSGGVQQETISIVVAPHGCALFVLQCIPL